MTELKQQAPDLVSKLIRTAPKPVAIGYQLLPRLTGDDPKIMAMRFTGPISVSYSWNKTQAYINWETSKLEELEEKFKVLPKLELKDRKPVLGKIVTDFVELEEDQRTVDEHLQYNRFWQRAVAEDKPRFDKLTVLHDLVLELQAIREALAAKDDATWRRAISRINEFHGIHAINPEDGRAAIDAELKMRATQYEKTIAAEADRIVPVPFLKFSVSKKGDWTLTAPLNTDIEDSAFLAKTKAAIESKWTVKTREGRRFRLRIELHRITPRQLYSKEKTPARGEHIDIEKHVAHFPKGAPVLTTGANMTYAIPGRYAALGPQVTATRVLAHEFGHILGFIDNYFRGYRDLGRDGFEILEVVSDPKNIMASPETGDVLPQHFEKLIRADAPPALIKKLK